MLLTRPALDRIVAGEVDLVFRRWRRPTVRTGGTLRTQVGMLAIDTVDQVPRSSLTPAEAHRAGYHSRAALLRDLDRRPEGSIYRIAVRFSGPDPRIALRERSDLSATDQEDLTSRLERLDRASRRGPWTMRYLRLLADNPRVRAQDLADGLGLEKQTFKNNVRKLKALGLTISRSPGYELSGRGRALLEALDPT